MRSYRRSAARRRGGGDNNFWLSFSDLMSSLVLIIILVMFYIIYQYFNMVEINEAEIARREYQLDQAQTELETQQSALTDAEKKMISQQIILDAKQKELDDAEAVLESQRTELATAQSRLDALDEQLAAQKSELEDAQAQLALQQSDLETAQTQLATREGELATAQEQLATREGELESAQEQLASQQGELENQQRQIEQLIGMRPRIISSLSDALRDSNISATVDTATGSITLASDVLFATGEYALTRQGRSFIDEFLPVYLNVLFSDEYAPYVSEIIIEGHTDSVGGYLTNLQLSQQRALSVASYVLGDSQAVAEDMKEHLRQVVTVNGRSYSDRIFDANGQENRDASRRVVFKFRLTDEQMIQQLRAILEGE